MRRRDFVNLLGSAAAAWPFPARAQQAGKRPIIGFLGTATASAWRDWVASFVERLRELGWVEGRTVAIEYRWAEGRSERFSEIATELARLKVDVILTSGTAVLPARQATSVIPIDFAVASDPIGLGMVASPPGDIPVEQPAKFELVLNLKTAKALGVDVPPTLIARADETIE
jgi:putative ABC transport system substrate-binding protein